MPVMKTPFFLCVNDCFERNYNILTFWWLTYFYTSNKLNYKKKNQLEGVISLLTPCNCSRRELCCFTRERNSSLVFNFRHILLFLLLQYFQNFPVSRKVPKTGVDFVVAAGEVICLEKKIPCFYVLWILYVLTNLTKWLTISWHGKAGCVLCKIGRVKSNYCVSLNWRDKHETLN